MVIWVISAVIVIFMLRQIDLVVHTQLYDFGLQFDHAWADAYWMYRNIIYVCIGLPMLLSVFAIALGFTKKIDKKLAKPYQTPAKKESKPAPSKAREARKNTKPIQESYTCSNCEKTFSKPLVSLSFERGKSKFVNTCPYCNHVIGEVEEAENK
jgi:DNA-directed RNA polymerase subunit RPC12/RpoP